MPQLQRTRFHPDFDSEMPLLLSSSETRQRGGREAQRTPYVFQGVVSARAHGARHFTHAGASFCSNSRLIRRLNMRQSGGPGGGCPQRRLFSQRIPVQPGCINMNAGFTRCSLGVAAASTLTPRRSQAAVFIGFSVAHHLMPPHRDLTPRST